MAIIKSSKKAIRQTKTRRARNLIYINKIKSVLKDTKAFVAQKKVKEAKEMLPKAFQILDKAAKVGIIKKNNASRRKSRLAKMIDRISK